MRHTSNYNQSGKPIHGFTLIELLVVISIIALLLGILMPALSKARQHAYRIKCQAQMRQFAVATRTYAASNNDEIPPHCLKWDLSTYQPLNNDYDYRWESLIAPYLDHKGEHSTAKVIEVAKCPSGKVDHDYSYDDWTAWIGMNYDPSVKPGDIRAPFIDAHLYVGGQRIVTIETQKFSNIDNPARYLMYMDSQTRTVYSPARMKWRVDHDGDGKKDSNERLKVGGRGNKTLWYNAANPKIHHGGSNVTLADGHVEYIKYEEIWKPDETGEYAGHAYWYENK